MRQKLIALIMVAIMTLSVCAAVGLTTATKVEAHTTTKLSLYAPSAVNYNEWYVLFVRLTDGSGHPLANKQVALSYHYSGGSFGGVWRWLTTDSNGYCWTWDRDWKNIYWKAEFKGDTSYAPSTSFATIQIKTATWLSFYAPSAVKKGDKFMLFGTLGNGGGDKTIYLYYRYSGATTWTYLKQVKTESSGFYNTTVSTSKYVTYYARFPGNAGLWPSTSVTRVVKVT